MRGSEPSCRSIPLTRFGAVRCFARGSRIAVLLQAPSSWSLLEEAHVLTKPGPGYAATNRKWMFPVRTGGAIRMLYCLLP